jgi:hypothetical protein
MAGLGNPVRSSAWMPELVSVDMGESLFGWFRFDQSGLFRGALVGRILQH